MKFGTIANIFLSYSNNVSEENTLEEDFNTLTSPAYATVIHSSNNVVSDGAIKRHFTKDCLDSGVKFSKKANAAAKIIK